MIAKIKNISAREILDKTFKGKDISRPARD